MKKLIMLLVFTCVFYGKDIPVFQESLELGNQPLAQVLKTVMKKFNFEYSVVADLSNKMVLNAKAEKGAIFEKFLDDLLKNYELTYLKDRNSKYFIRSLTEEEISILRLNCTVYKFREKYNGCKFDEEIFYTAGTVFDCTLKQALRTLFVNNGIPYSWYSDEDKKKYEDQIIKYTVSKKDSLKDILQQNLKKFKLKYAVDQTGAVCILNEDQNIKVVTKVYRLTYSSAKDIVRQMRQVLKVDGTCEVDVGTNSLIITDHEEVFEGIESLLKEL